MISKKILSKNRSLASQIKTLFLKELKIEWRKRYAINGILLYVTCTVFICYLSFNLRRGILHPVTWNALFWILMLFSAVNAVEKSFSNEGENRNLYYYSVVKAEAVIFSKILYNVFILILMGFTGAFFYMLIMGNPVKDPGLFFINLILGAFGFATTLSLISGISSSASGRGTFMVILGFPVILPVLMMLLKISKNAIDGLNRSLVYDELGVLAALNVIVIVLSFILFPYLWKN